ncbi:MAG: Gp37 family protein [Spirulina sp.]
MITEIIKEIVDELKPQLETEQITTEAVAEGIEQWDNPLGSGLVLVGYRGRDLQEPNGQKIRTAPTIQKVRYTFRIIVKLFDLQSHEKAESYLDKINDILTGFRPTIAPDSPLFQTSDEFIERDNGFWIYEMLFSLNKPLQKKPRHWRH